MCDDTIRAPHGLITVHISVPTAAGTAKFVWWLTGVPVATGEALTVVPDPRRLTRTAFALRKVRGRDRVLVR